MLVCDFSKMSMPANLHLAFQALFHFQKQYNSSPKPWDEVFLIEISFYLDNDCLFLKKRQSDADKFYEIVEKLNREHGEQPLTEELNKLWIKLFAKTCTGDLCPMQAVLGGVAAQEAMKVRNLFDKIK